MTDLLVIANGRFQRGGTGRRWDRVMRRLRELFGNGVEICFTSGPGDATRLAREALRAGAGWIAAAGGDGTIHEAVNGYFERDRNIQPNSTLSFLPCGSGNDWVRTLDFPSSLLPAVEKLASSGVRSVDVGLARYRNLNGAAEERVFINVAEAGIGGEFLLRRANSGQAIPGWLGYRLATLTTALSHRPQPMQLVLDGTKAWATGPLLSLIVAGGQYFGGGMHCAPMARPDDGLFEIITLGNFGKLEILTKLGDFFAGNYFSEPKVEHYSARALEAISGEKVYLELDGELAGTLPANFTLLPQALRIRY